MSVVTDALIEQVQSLERERDEARRWARFYRETPLLSGGRLAMEPEPDWLTTDQPAAEEGER